MATPWEEKLTETDCGLLADHVLPNCHERLATALGLPSELVPNLRASYREDQWGISNKILMRWLNVHYEEDNRIVSTVCLLFKYYSRVLQYFNHLIYQPFYRQREGS